MTLKEMKEKFGEPEVYKDEDGHVYIPIKFPDHITNEDAKKYANSIWKVPNKRLKTCLGTLIQDKLYFDKEDKNCLVVERV